MAASTDLQWHCWNQCPLCTTYILIVSPDESRIRTGLSRVMSPPPPPQRFPFGRDNLKNILVRTSKFGMWVYMGNAMNAKVTGGLLKVRFWSLYPQTKVGDILDSGPSRRRCRRRRRRRRRNFLVDAITQKQINIFFSNLVHMLRVPKGRSLF